MSIQNLSQPLNTTPEGPTISADISGIYTSFPKAKSLDENVTRAHRSLRHNCPVSHYTCVRMRRIFMAILDIVRLSISQKSGK